MDLKRTAYQKLLLGEVNDIIVGALIISIDRSLRAHEPDIRTSGDNGSHGFIRSKPCN